MKACFVVCAETGEPFLSVIKLLLTARRLNQNYHCFSRILIVDDHVDSAETLNLLLTHSGYETFLAHNGESAIQVAKEHKPEVALLDIGLPDMNGYELARALREMLPSIRLIAISGWNREEDRKRSAEAEFDYHLVKPIDLSEIRRLLSEGQCEQSRVES